MSRKMKDSGVAWIGEIPSEWKVSIVKTVLQNVSEKNHPDAEVLSLYRDWGIVPKNSRDDNFNVTSEKTEQYKFVEIGDLVINKMKAWQGSLAVSEYEGIVSPAYYVCKFKNEKMNKKYIHHLFRSSVYAQQWECLSTGMRVGQWDLSIDDFLTSPLLIPPIEEQNEISDKIDKKCRQIDALISNQQKQIEKLKQYKQSVITEVVTKGLNPDAEMKDSGVEWIGEIPREWKVIATKILFKLESGATPKSEVAEYWDGNIKWITPADYKTEDKYVEFGRRNLTQEGYDACSATLIPKNSIIFSKRAPIGAVVINREELCTNQGCLSCIPIRELCIEYYYYVMSVCTEIYNLLGSGTTFKEISGSSFGNFVLPMPSIKEQTEISKWLNLKTDKINSLIAIKQQKIEKLNQYKKSVIYEYVTGKKEA